MLQGETGMIIAAIVVAAVVMIIFNLTSHIWNKNRYKVDYCGSEAFYEGAKKTYKAGTKVKLYYTMEVSDMDMSFYLDDEYLNAKYDGKKGYLIEFVMPNHDVKLECRISESMTYVDNSDVADE